MSVRTQPDVVVHMVAMVIIIGGFTAHVLCRDQVDEDEVEKLTKFNWKTRFRRTNGLHVRHTHTHWNQ